MEHHPPAGATTPARGACPSRAAPPPSAQEAGRRLGHDLAVSGAPCALRDAWPASVREGFDAAPLRSRRHAGPDRFERKWLQLRLSAHQRGRVIDDSVTPELLRRIDVAICPVMRLTLTHARRADTDWSIDRLNNDGGYAANNLAVMCTRANRAKGERGFGEVIALSRRSDATDGLEPVQWLRLAGLMLGPCFTLEPSKAPLLALAVELPVGVVLNVTQQVQYAFSRLASRPSGKNALLRHFRPACQSEGARMRLQLLADAMHAASKGLAFPCDGWLEPSVLEALRRWRDSVDERAWGMAGAIAGRVACARQLDPSRIDGWRLPSRGYVS